MIIDWQLTSAEITYLVKHFLPIGNMTSYEGEGKFENNPILHGCRFLKDRTSNIKRLGHNMNSMRFKNFPYKMLAYSFDQSLQVMMYDLPELYRKLTKLTIDIENLAENYILDCEHSAVLIGHNSLGENLTLHTHRLTDIRKFTFTITVRLSFINDAIQLSFYDPISNSDKNLPYYYPNPPLINEYILNKEKYTILMKNPLSLLLFSASHIPHAVNFDNDLYLFYVYDNVTLKKDRLEEIKSLGISYFTENSEGKHLYYGDLPNSPL